MPQLGKRLLPANLQLGTTLNASPPCPFPVPEPLALSQPFFGVPR